MKTILKIFAVLLFVTVPPALAWHTFAKPLTLYFDALDWLRSETISLKVDTKSSRGKTHTMVEYTFKHQLGNSTGRTIQFWPGSSRNSIDPRLVGAKTMTVWYDPDDPNRSVLFRSIDWVAFSFGLIPCVLSFFSPAMLAGLTTHFISRKFRYA
jgi:hypothetical protein